MKKQNVTNKKVITYLNELQAHITLVRESFDASFSKTEERVAAIKKDVNNTLKSLLY